MVLSHKVLWVSPCYVSFLHMPERFLFDKVACLHCACAWKNSDRREIKLSKDDKIKYITISLKNFLSSITRKFSKGGESHLTTRLNPKQILASHDHLHA